MMVAGVGTGVGFSNLKNCRTWCQAKFRNFWPLWNFWPIFVCQRFCFSE